MTRTIIEHAAVTLVCALFGAGAGLITIYLFGTVR